MAFVSHAPRRARAVRGSTIASCLGLKGMRKRCEGGGGARVGLFDLRLHEVQRLRARARRVSFHEAPD